MFQINWYPIKISTVICLTSNIKPTTKSQQSKISTVQNPDNPKSRQPESRQLNIPTAKIPTIHNLDNPNLEPIFYEFISAIDCLVSLSIAGTNENIPDDSTQPVGKFTYIMLI